MSELTSRAPTPATWRDRSIEARVVLGATTAALLALVPGVPGPLRAAAAVGFLLVVPGLAWIHALPLSGAVERGAVAVALSVGADALVAEALLFAGLPGPVPAAFVLAALALGGVVVEHRLQTEEPA